MPSEQQYSLAVRMMVEWSAYGSSFLAWRGYRRSSRAINRHFICILVQRKGRGDTPPMPRIMRIGGRSRVLERVAVSHIGRLSWHPTHSGRCYPRSLRRGVRSWEPPAPAGTCCCQYWIKCSADDGVAGCSYSHSRLPLLVTLAEALFAIRAPSALPLLVALKR
jgi:hypothetical protein